MKEFEKWREKQEVSKYNPGAWGAYEDGWQAALEWVLNKPLDKRIYNCDYTRAKIKQELEN